VKRLSMAAALLALMSGAAIAQSSSPAQPADPEEAQRKGTISQPTGAGATPPASTVGTPTQSPSPEEAQRKGTISEPGTPNR
jgi:hypothetical protein